MSLSSVHELEDLFYATQDDLTKETIAKAMGERIVVSDMAMEALKSHYRKSERPMTENNLKQAYMPESAEVLPNDQGTAPGFWLEKDGKIIVSMPGPPREMTNMFSKEAPWSRRPCASWSCSAAAERGKA